MANYNTLKTSIQEVIRTNGNEEITGQLLQNTLIAMINSLGAEYQFAGIAIPTTDPGTPDQNVAYIAGPGTYPNFNNTTIPMQYIGIFQYDENGWQYNVFQTATMGFRSQGDGVVQLYDGDTPIFPITKAAAVKTANDTILENIVKALDLSNSSSVKGYLFRGVVSTDITPDTPEQPVFYLAASGTYTHFGTSFTINPGFIGVIRYNGSWSHESIQVGTADAVKYTEQTLTESEKAQARTNIGAANDAEVVKFVEQTLSDAQKLQARINIGAADNDNVVNLSSVVAQIIQKSLIAGEQISHTVITGQYVRENGDTGSWGSANIYLYPVTAGNIINVFGGRGGSSAACKYGFYSSSSLSSATAVLVSGKSTDAAYNDIVVVPAGASYIAVTVAYNAPTGVSNVVGLADNGIITLDKLAQSIFDSLPTEDSAKLLTSGAIYQALKDLDLSQVIYETISPDETVNGKWIAAGGEIRELSSYKLNAYNVQPGQKVKIVRTTPFPSAASRIYAIYSTRDSSQWGTANCLDVSAVALGYGDVEIELTIPAGGASLVVVQLPAQDYLPYVQNQVQIRLTITDFLALKARVAELESQMSVVLPIVNRDFCVELDADGESLYIAYLLGTTEYVYWFKECMSNELYTFYRVGYRTVTRNYADTDGISSLSGITLLNSTGSDNIGPLGFNDGGLVGGNHLWNNDTELRVKTAKTDSYTIYVNGKQMVAGDKIYTDKVIVKVVNTLYDPAETPTAGQAILTIPASTETVVYEVSENNIFVSVNQHLADNCNNILNRYYGMQSMFGDSDHPESYITPRGQYTDWQAAANASFIKSSYPDFNRFVEKNSNGYQSTYLLPSKYGLHDKLRNNQKIWDYAGSKAYHHLFFVNDFTEATPGLSFTWSGIYTFFASPIIDNSDALVYSGIINGKQAIFANAKRACTINIPLQDYTGRAITEVERDTTITTDNAFVDVDGVAFTATGAGSYIFVIG